MSGSEWITNVATLTSTHRGENFRSWLQSVDFGLDEAWVIKVHWYRDFGMILSTMYEPPFVCEMEPCLHLASRWNWNDLYLDWDGNVLTEDDLAQWIDK